MDRPVLVQNSERYSGPLVPVGHHTHIMVTGEFAWHDVGIVFYPGETTQLLLGPGVLEVPKDVAMIRGVRVRAGSPIDIWLFKPRSTQ